MSEKPRLRRDDLKDLVLKAGIELLYEDGLGAGTAPIGYVDAFRWLEEHRSISVSRAQVHRRIWDSLDDYRQDVILAVAGYTPDHSYMATIDALGQTMADLQLEGTSARDRTTMVAKLAVELTETNANSLRSQRAIAAFDAIFVMFSLGNTDSADTTAVHRKIIDSTLSATERYIALYEYIAEMFGAAPGSVWGLSQAEGIELFSELLRCLNHGASGRSAFEPNLQDIRIGDRTCSVEGLGAAALVSNIAMIDGLGITEHAHAPAPPPAPVAEPEPSQAPQPPPGRLDRETLRALMIEAGMAVLVENGFGHGAEHITYGRVFERVQHNRGISVSRAQVHGRIWASQNDFQLELLQLATVDRMSLAAERVAEAAVEQIANTDLEAEGGTRLAMARAIRVGAVASLDSTIESTSWMLSQAVMSFHALNTDRQDIIGDALHDTYEEEVALWAQIFKESALALDYGPRPWTQLSLDEVAVVAARCIDVIADGVVMRTRMMGESTTYRLSIAEEQAQEWNLLAIGCWCIVEFLARPNPR